MGIFGDMKRPSPANAARTARVIAGLAFLGVVCTSPVPTTTLPKVVFGLYQAVPGSENNVAEFARIVSFPDSVEFDERNLVGFRKEGEIYHKRFWFAATNVFVDLPFKLGEKQTTVFNGKNIEGNDTTAVFHAKFRETSGDARFSVEAMFNNYGYNATYSRDGVVAKRSYRRTLPGYIFGAYELDTSNSSGHLAAFYNEWFPLPAGISWRNDIKWWLGRRGDKFYEKFVAGNVFYDELEFQLNTVGRISHDNDTVSYKYEAVRSSPGDTTLTVTYNFPGKGVIVLTDVFDREGVTSTAKSSTTEVTSRFKRVLPWLFYGKFQDVPEKAENFEEFLRPGDCPFDNQTFTLDISRKDDRYFARRTTSDGSKLDFEFKLNTPQELQSEGKAFTYHSALATRGDKVILVSKITIQATNRTYIVEEYAHPEGIHITYKRDDIVAKKFLRRIVPKIMIGTFEAAETNDALKDFTNVVGRPELLKNITVEYSQDPDGTFVAKQTFDGVPAAREIRMTFGKTHEMNLNGKHLQSTLYYYEPDNAPVFRSVVNEVGSPGSNFEVTSVFRPDGFTSTVVYADHTKTARRNYIRKGDPVPVEAIH